MGRFLDCDKMYVFSKCMVTLKDDQLICLVEIRLNFLQNIKI